MKKCAALLGLIVVGVWLTACKPRRPETSAGTNPARPRIVNIVNFIRLLEPRDAKITRDVLYQTVVRQLEVMKQNRLKVTFLLQYDALIDPRYQQLLKQQNPDSIEIGAWWEIPQPLVEKAGLKWRGRYPWDWYANIGFSPGYSPDEREKLADVYMEDFKAVFGFYPKSVASWFIDAHTLNYLYEHYHITASANCKDQYGTDGYTLWGGYWNQAYYPSKINSYMPAQHPENQIPVPVFRMLGSDPVRQYDHGLGSKRQGVVTLEPVYPEAGGDAAWVDWYFKEFVNGAAMEFAYTQAGQENSFTWDAMSKGFLYQMPLIARLRDENKLTVETLAESGKWFRDHYEVTPATSMTALDDLNGDGRKTVWFNSRFYRANILWENGTMRFRDIHLFDEKLTSVYETEKATANECSFYTLPFVDGFIWSTATTSPGLYVNENAGDHFVALEGTEPTVTDTVPGTLHIVWPLKSGKGTLELDLTEQQVKITMNGQSPEWSFGFASAYKNLPFTSVEPGRISCEFQGMKYSVYAEQGKFSRTAEGYTIAPANNVIVLRFGK